MSEQKTKFEIACENRLRKVVIGELRAFGRRVGVSRPTDTNKASLIAAILDVFMGRAVAIPRSTRGAPVKADYFDPQIAIDVQKLWEEYMVGDLPAVSAEEAAAQMQRLQEELGGEENVLIVRSSDVENLEKSVVVGQVQTVDGVSSLVPLSGEDFALKILIKTEHIYGYALREGDVITCRVQESGRSYFTVTSVLTINGVEPSSLTRFSFDEEDVFPPEKQIKLLTNTPASTVAKYFDWFIPLGAGQRALLYGAPKTGKTQMLQSIAKSLVGREEYEVFVLLIEQPPETVSTFKRIVGKDKVVASVYGDEAERHVAMAELALKRAKRFAETGKDVLLLVDGIDNLGEAFNELDSTEEDGKTPVQGLSSATVRFVKKFFGAARNFEKQGSLTIIATAKHSLGNPASDFIAAELLDMANCRILLREDLAVKRIYPAIDLSASSADQAEELLVEKATIERAMRNRILPKLGEEEVGSLLMQSETVEEFVKAANTKF